jgi:hypothetical protein
MYYLGIAPPPSPPLPLSNQVFYFQLSDEVLRWLLAKYVVVNSNLNTPQIKAIELALAANGEL